MKEKKEPSGMENKILYLGDMLLNFRMKLFDKEKNSLSIAADGVTRSARKTKTNGEGGDEEDAATFNNGGRVSNSSSSSTNQTLPLYFDIVFFIEKFDSFSELVLHIIFSMVILTCL